MGFITYEPFETNSLAVESNFEIFEITMIVCILMI